MSKISLLNVQVDNLVMDEAVAAIENLVKQASEAYVVTPNLDHIVLLEEDDEFKMIYKHASLVFADGQPLIWLSKLFGTPLVAKISGSDLFPEVCKMCAKQGYTIFILGAAEGVAKAAANNLVHKFPELKIKGWYSPQFGFENDHEEIRNIIEIITTVKPDILAIALGSPKGEKFIYKYRKQLNVPVSMSIGATIDFEAGKIKRAPVWMSNYGLEWLHRLINDPSRLAKRYWKDARMIGPIILKYYRNRNGRRS